MTTFRFNFSNKIEALEQSNQSGETGKDVTKWLDSEEVFPNKEINEYEETLKHAKMFTCGDVEIGHIILSDALTSMCRNGLVELAESKHSDLIPGLYEGGLKIWECTCDLLKFIEENKDSILLKDKCVLDLGCGAGILGIYALINGSTLTFQDYNKEILENVTVPNVLLNTEEENSEDIFKKCKFYSGDWRSFNKLLPKNQKYDVILTSETIYNEENYEKLVELFTERLKDSGVVYLAAKTHYFGVGGGTRKFETVLEKTGNKLQSVVCWKSTQGVMREIIKINIK